MNGSTGESNGRPKRAWWIAALIGAAAGLGAIAFLIHYLHPVTIQGAIIKLDDDPRKQSPIADVEVTIVEPNHPVTTKSDFSGYFRLPLPRELRQHHSVVLRFRHPDYEPLDTTEDLKTELYVIRLTPVNNYLSQLQLPHHAVADILVRYSIQDSTPMNIGTGVTTFQVKNAGNVPCNHHAPCSPDGKWKAAVASASLDAGDGNVYDDARLSCIAGPCPFARIVSDHFSHGGRIISVSVLGWSDTTTFLLQAEVTRQQISDITRAAYPVVFGQSLNFTLPPAAHGTTLLADIDGTSVVFPLAPTPVLSWADCNVRVGRDQSKIYRCELKPGYQFK